MGFITFSRKDKKILARKLYIKCSRVSWHRCEDAIKEEIFYCPFCGEKFEYLVKSNEYK